MGETLRTFTATTSEFGDERADGIAGVTIRYGTEEIEFVPATVSPASAWTRSAAHELLGIYGYETTGDWTDIGVDDPIWEVTVARTGPQGDVAADVFGEFTAVDCDPEQAVELLFGIECDDDCPECNPA